MLNCIKISSKRLRRRMQQLRVVQHLSDKCPFKRVEIVYESGILMMLAHSVFIGELVR